MIDFDGPTSAEQPCEIILASTSPYRKALLERLGLSFRCVPPQVNEADEKLLATDAATLAERLAVAKAEAVAARFPRAVVIGSDQVPAIGAERLDKPGSAECAVSQLTRLAGQTHELLTAVCVLRTTDGKRLLHLDRTRLTMRSLDRSALQRYVALDDPRDCAGAYKIEQAGISLFERIETDDFTAITGLPLIALGRMLREFGIQVP